MPAGCLMLSDYLPGRSYALQSLWSDGDLILAKACEWMEPGVTFAPGGAPADARPPGPAGPFARSAQTTAILGRAVDAPVPAGICMAAVRVLDRHANGLFCVELKEDRDGVPCVTDIHVGTFFAFTPLFDGIGRHNMADLYVRLALGEEVSVAAEERLNDIGAGESYLIRDFDGEPLLLPAAEIARRYTELSQEEIRQILERHETGREK